MIEILFICPELGRVDENAGRLDSGLMFDVQHFVEHHVIDNILGDVRGIEQAADEYHVMGGVVAPQDVSSSLYGPKESGLIEATVKVLSV